MKKVFTIVLIFAAIAAQAQSTFFSTTKSTERISFGVEVGINVSNMGGDYYYDDGGVSSLAGLNLGIAVDIPLLESLYIKTGLYHTERGCKWEYVDSEEKILEKYRPVYLQLPVLASYRHNFTDNIQLQVNVGPYFALGVGGKDKYEYSKLRSSGTYTGTEEWVVFGEDQIIKKFDAGLHIGAGLTLYRHFSVGIGYEFSFTNIYDYDGWKQDDLIHYTVYNRSLIFKVGYMF